MIERNPYIRTHKSDNGDYFIVNTYDSTLFKVRKGQEEQFQKVIEEMNGAPKVMELLKEKNIIYDKNEKSIPDYDLLFEDFLKLRSEELLLILLPTEGCNFRCTYCYESHDNKFMSKETQDAIINFVEQNIFKYKKVRLNWFGGEPLCQMGIVDDLSRRVREICKREKKTFLGSMTTNGYLLDLETFKKMYRKNKIVSYQITLDGLADTHDIQRPLANKQGTFDTIMTNLKAIRDNVKSSCFKIMIRCNVTKNVLVRFQDYLVQMYEEFGEDERFNFFWKIAWEPNYEENENYLSENTFGDLLKLAGDKKLRIDLIRVQLAKFGMICYASYPGCFVIGADATIYKCTVAFDSPRNQVGMLKPDGSMELDKEKLNYWSGTIDADNIEKCRKCSLAPSCLGIACRNTYKNSENQIGCPGMMEQFGNIVEAVGQNEDYYEIIEV